ncbi:hypothetical protein K7X08_026573 [Anisodus acutangulus]|uniref:pectinesterase n=1 Tax=Anisodus acutangulus TaxID=402998 RepID=A0A9Q1LQQ4_9SOLA|nr:hypothetical protein K7X08_026573 [Anisodus acutangulus]
MHVIPGEAMAMVTAHARAADNVDSGYSFVHCTVTGTGKTAYLGRAWKPFSKVVFSYSDLSDVVHPEGWSDFGKKEFDSWFDANVKPLDARKDNLDPALVAAEANKTIIKVRSDGSGDFKTLTDAINSIPEGNKRRVIISIGGGNYTEKVKIERSKPFITLYGDPKNVPNIIFNGTAKEYNTVDSATVVVESEYFSAVNINFVNSAPRPDGKRELAQAAALRTGGDKASLYNCKMFGFQDTFCDDSGKHFFKDCYIEGTVDFIFGNGKSLYLNTEMHVIPGEAMAMVTAHARAADNVDSGYSFVHCTVTGTGKTAYLGRAWKPFSKVVFSYSDLSDVVHPEGWSDFGKKEFDSWFDANVKPLDARKDNLDPALVAAEANKTIIKVRSDGSGDFKTLTDAINSIPEANKRRVIISIGGGNYTEKVKIERSKPFITLYGDPKNVPNIIFNGTAKEYNTVDSATVVVESEYFSAVNINFVNSAPRPDGKRELAQAAALRTGGDKASLYNCKMFGFQDTFCDDSGKHFFKDCYIEGTVDFIFGNGKSLYLNTEMHVIPGEAMAMVTAHARAADNVDSGYSFVHCTVTGTGKTAYLGRAWKPFSKVVFSYSDLSDVVHPEGWSDFGKKEFDSWFDANVKPLEARKDNLDPALVAAEANKTIIKVRSDGSGDFKTLTDAINSIPEGNKRRVIISIAGGNYTEKVKIERSKPFITLYGDPKNVPNIIFNGTAKEYNTVDSATVVVESEYFSAVNINFVNSAPRPDGKRELAQAAALRTGGDKASLYNCKMFGFQDTFCDDSGKHFFKDCYIEGTVDFIFGNGKSLYLSRWLMIFYFFLKNIEHRDACNSREAMAMVTAHARAADNVDSGYSFVHCTVTGTGKTAYLGRAWKPFSKVVFSYSDLSDVVHPEGWSDFGKKEFDSWFDANVKPLDARKDNLDPALVAAEANKTIIKVRSDGSGDFKTLTDAINSIPEGNKRRVIISIGGGNYTEKIKIERSKPFITLYGDPKNVPNIIFNGTAKEYNTVDSATVVVESEYFSAVNINFVNSAPRPDGKRELAQAAALRTGGDKASLYNCKMFGFQDTFCDDSGKHFFKDCYIEGTVDFIFGNGKSLYLNTEMHVIPGEAMAMVTAHARAADNVDSGYSFVHCTVTGTGKTAYLGRAWKPFSKVVFSYSDLSDVVHPEGWSDFGKKEFDRSVTVSV